MDREARLGPRHLFLLQIATVVGLLFLFLSAMSATEAADGGVGLKLFLLLRMAFLVLLCTWFLRRDGERWADVGLRWPRRWWLVPVLVVGGFFALLVLNDAIRTVLLPALGASSPQLGFKEEWAGDIPTLLFSLLVAWSSAAFGEELLMRGFILDRITKVIGSSNTPTLLVAIVAQAALFGAAHFYQGLGGVLITGMIGLLMGIIWLLGGRNLWACIILHGLVNTISAYEAYTWVPR